MRPGCCTPAAFAAALSSAAHGAAIGAALAFALVMGGCASGLRADAGAARADAAAAATSGASAAATAGPTSSAVASPPPTAAAAPPADSAPPAAAEPREATPRYDAQGRLIGFEAASGTTLVTPGEVAMANPTLGVQVEVVAPPALKALLERHLDVVRLGRMAREEVEEAEWARLIDAAPAQALELLQTEGYFSARVTPERAPRRAVGEPDLVRLVVEPGPQARVSRLTLETQGELDTGAAGGDPVAREALHQLRQRWPLQPGMPFSNSVWSDAKSSALARLRAAGYAGANWVGTGAEVDPATDSVRIFVVVDSGPLYRLGSLEIEGLVAHDAETVQNLLAAHRGQAVTETLLLDFQERLQKANLFAAIAVTLDPDPAGAAAARVNVRLHEAPLQVWTFGIGASANTGPRASVEHTYRRVFGYAATARNKVEWGQKRQAWDGEISTHTLPGLNRWLIGGAVENLEGDADTVLSQRLRLGRAQDGVRIDRLAFLEGERSVRTTDVTRTSAVAVSLNYQGVWRDVDSVVLPTRGFTFSGQVGFGRSHATAAETGWFTRAYGRFTGYLPIGDTWYGQARLELGQVFLKTGVVAPESQRFRAGGDDSVRGYGYRSLGPLVDGVVGSGNALVTTSVEMARPISASLPSVWGAVFVDAGNAADSFSGLKPALGMGVGVRWRSPVGPLRLDWAYGREVRRSRLHFSVGIVF